LKQAGLRFADPAQQEAAFLKRATGPKDLKTRGGKVFDRGAETT
jgi:hypothetical protein